MDGHKENEGMRHDVVAVVPTYNNGRTLRDVVLGIREYLRDVIVVDDGSTDDTPSVLSSLGDAVRVIRHPSNRGKGNALKTGLSEARRSGYRYAITIDSDGQHFPSDIPSFLSEIEKTPGAVLVGARNISAENMPGKNSFANRFSNFWYRLETGNRLSDTQSGFRLYPVQDTDYSKWWYTGKYEFELEAIVFASWRGVTVRNIPVKVYYQPPGERVSHFRPVRDFFRIYRIVRVLSLDRTGIRAAAKEFPSAEVTARNIPMSSEELRRKLGARPSDRYHIFGLRVSFRSAPSANCLFVTVPLP